LWTKISRRPEEKLYEPERFVIEVGTVQIESNYSTYPMAPYKMGFGCLEQHTNLSST
jgi:hypothetical protein